MSLLSKKSTETNKYVLEISVSAEDFEKAVNAAYRKESKNMQIQGFRKGKAPRAIIEKMYGDKVFYDTAIDSLYRPTVMEAVDASELKVVSIGEMDIKEASKENGLQFELTVVVKPEVKIEGYKGIEVEKTSTEVTDEEVDEAIKNVQERNSRVITVEDRATQNGDIAVIDFEGFVDGVAFDGGKAESHELTLGTGQFIPGFEEQVVGHNVGEEFDVVVTFPEEYHSEDLKGKEATFKIKLHEIKAKELPELDDEFAKDVSEFDTLAEYKADQKAKLVEAKEKSVEAEFENKIVDALIEKMEAEIPAEMFDNEINEAVNNFAYRLQSQGLNIDTYMQYTNMDMAAIREQFRAQAEKSVKARLALEAVSVSENLKATDEEIEKEFEKLAEMYQMPVENVKGMVNPTDLTLDVEMQKAVQLVKDAAVIK